MTKNKDPQHNHQHIIGFISDNNNNTTDNHEGNKIFTNFF